MGVIKSMVGGWLAALLAALLVACGGGNGASSGATGSSPQATASSPYPAAAASCSVADQRAWLRDYMTDQYFWYDRQGVPNENATSMSQYFSSLLAAGLDRFSGSQPTAQFLQLNLDGKSLGYGYQLAWADTAKTQLRFRLVEPLSPLGLAGVRRGDRVIQIDGFMPSEIVAGALPAVSSAGVPRQFILADPVLAQRTVTVLSAEYAISPVLHASVLTAANGAKVGYLVYQEFNATGAAALGSAIIDFKAAGVSELILDLRYNGGGSTTQARNVASLIGGAGLGGKAFAQFRFNDKYSRNNVTQTFTASLLALPTTPLSGIYRLVVITSGSTASASEMVINGLRPYMPVELVGNATFGKPYGSQPRDSCGTTYSAVNIEIVNALGTADFGQGFAPTCAVADDVTKPWGDATELRTAAALGFIATGACPVTAQAPAARAAMASGQRGSYQDGASESPLGEVLPPRAWVDR